MGKKQKEATEEAKGKMEKIKFYNTDRKLQLKKGIIIIK